MEALGLTGGVLHVNGKIAAFTYGAPINHETWAVSYTHLADKKVLLCANLPGQGLPRGLHIYIVRRYDLHLSLIHI